MLISADTRISFPLSLVYATYRDKLIELVPYMPNVRQIEVKSRQEEDKRVYSINEWHGGGDIPLAARAILSEDMLSWTEYNTWNEAEFVVEWQIKTHAFTEAVHCAGKNRFIADGDATLIKSCGELIIDPKQIKGVPWFIATKVANIVEDFLSKKVEPNLFQMSEGVRQYLEKQTKG
ncbi:hypothetical protein CEN45_14835 [Fischerella thermalis CCMEE 5198]|jgi:hypothetical protein|uniref:hypothetical protein n=1 Tax=Fischerella thermalis TaxID=372787 RepID=UPI000C808E7C|nr:hypothetical protein [Fischerella thermalis]PMB21402.1 hypothetical protein CEN45_14835 [Fischerella thermalis CCMEE 5198]